MASDVYFMNSRSASIAEGVQFKAVRLLRDAGLDSLFKPGDTVGIKVKLGEYGNTATLRPQLVRAVVDEVRRLGGKPFVIDTTSLPWGEYPSRALAEDCRRAAAANGFTAETLGCPISIADGDGFNERQVVAANGALLRSTFIAEGFLKLDACIVLSHFAGDPFGVVGGALEHVGVGMASKRGKLEALLLNHDVYGMSNSGIYQAVAENAAQTSEIRMNTGGAKLAGSIAEGEQGIMQRLVASCPFDALRWEDTQLEFDKSRCKNCGCCFISGYFSGVIHINPEMIALWPIAIADSAAAFIAALGREKLLYVNYCLDMTPWGDAAAFSDSPMLPDIGVFASADPVALDMACLEAALGATPVPASKAADMQEAVENNEWFTYCSGVNKMSQWAQINAAVFGGAGVSEYRLTESAPLEEQELRAQADSGVFAARYKDALAARDYAAGEFWHIQPRLSYLEMCHRPSGRRIGN